MMICNSVHKCGITDQETCFTCVPHESSNVKSSGPVMCWRINGRVRLVPARSYDAEGRAARLECIRQARFQLRMIFHWKRMGSMFEYQSYHNEVRVKVYKLILAAMRDARKGAKNG